MNAGLPTLEQPLRLRPGHDRGDDWCSCASWTTLVSGAWWMAKAADLELEAMKDDVRALRDALEAAQSETAAAEQRAHAARQSEIDQLQAVIAALREEMIRQREELLAAVQAAERDGAAEAEQLREAVVAARRHADDLQQQHEGGLARQGQRFETERRELHDTITELRRRLETTTPDDHR